MAYFSRLGSIWYIMPDGTQIQLNDISKFASIDPKYKNDPRFYLDYQLKDGDRPDVLSNRLYGTPDYWYTIYLVNDITDYTNQWPRDDDQLEAYINDKYPFSSHDDILYYVDINGFITDPEAMKFKVKTVLMSDPDIIAEYELSPVTIWDHENQLNENKRHIRLVDPDQIMSFDRQHKELLSNT